MQIQIKMKAPKNKITIWIIAILFYLFFTTPGYAKWIDDNGKISATNVSEVVHVHHLSDILNAIQKAKKHHLPIAISAVQHSQGGQTLIRNGIILDMLPYNRVLQINRKKMQVTVEPGITWSALQHAINPYHLSIQVMQTSDIFSVGGTVSVNAHGLDFRKSPILNTIISVDLVLANGSIIHISPTEHVELWRSVIGGYGLLGVIKDVTLQLVPNDYLVGHVAPMTISNLNHQFTENILPDKNAVLFLGRLSMSPNKTLLKNGFILSFTDTHTLPKKIIALDNPEDMDFFITPIFNLARHFNFAKRMMWKIQVRALKKKYNNTLMTRNNAMRFAIKFAVDHHEKNHADWLQEYFLPPNRLATFVNFFRSIVIHHKIDLLNATVRYVQGNTTSFLTYAKKPEFGLVIYFDQTLSKKKIKQAREWTRLLINEVQILGGNYYLPYQAFPTKNQFEKSYPGYQKFLKIKKKYDPTNLFQNEFFQDYF